ncbi:molybdenum cofactor biosynthesis protein B [endosymbiont of Riftia pachyptila (vent Ph05)]|uniref:Molybdenum cofactor biosynthesis protein B n=1 Tax=endosymbiont of Riftia pachyptila (vent Ph05) TaxID=1048808 RepID=G2D9H9_9GAMM|nr:molybdenum cofactor biosynthesis protein B [endosymbiont of Riftia pachyptila (vent Ph05)]
MSGHFNDSGFVPLNIAVLTLSDSRTEETDKSGLILKERALEAGHRVVEKAIVPDDVYQMRAIVSRWIADDDVHIIISTGGTGITGATAPRKRCSRCSISRSRALVSCSAPSP